MGFGYHVRSPFVCVGNTIGRQDEKKQRLGIARALWKNTHVIFADEPTASLDAENRQLVTHLLTQHAHNGGIVITATHDSELVDACTHIVDLGRAAIG